MQHLFTGSGHIHSFDYDNASRSVTVKFSNGTEYVHTNVPLAAVENWTKYRSAGEFYHHVIRKYAGSHKASKAQVSEEDTFAVKTINANISNQK